VLVLFFSHLLYFLTRSEQTSPSQVILLTTSSRPISSHSIPSHSISRFPTRDTPNHFFSTVACHCNYNELSSIFPYIIIIVLNNSCIFRPQLITFTTRATIIPAPTFFSNATKQAKWKWWMVGVVGTHTWLCIE